MDVFLADLHETASALVQEFPSQQETIPQVREIRVNADLPCVAESTNLLGLGRQICVPAVGHLAPVHERLEVGAVADAVGRVHVDQLDLPAETFFLDQAVHDQKAVACDQAVGPVMPVTVELDGLS